MRLFSRKHTLLKQRTSDNLKRMNTTASKIHSKGVPTTYRQGFIEDQGVQSSPWTGDIEPAPSLSFATKHLPLDFSQIPVLQQAAKTLQPERTLDTTKDRTRQPADSFSQGDIPNFTPAHQSTCSRKKLGNQADRLTPRDGHPGYRSTRGEGGTTVPPIVHKVLHTNGQPLDRQTRAFMEPRFGHDFGHIRVYADKMAAESAQAVGAQAYTFGPNIVFDEGRYTPGSPVGQRLIAHELAHTIQQRFAGSEKPLSSPGIAETHERAAVNAAHHIEIGQPPGPLGTSKVGIAKQDKPETEELPARDTMAGTLVSSIIIDLRTGRVGFVVPAPKVMILGNVSTDLKPGEYTVRPDFETGRWVFKAKAGQRGVKPGLRFNVSLEGALPWTLAYPDELPVHVGLSTTLKGGGPVDDSADLVRVLDEMSGIPDLAEDPTIDGFIDYEYIPTWVSQGEQGSYSTTVTLKYLGGAGEVFDLATVGDGTMSEEERLAALEGGTETAGGRRLPRPLNRSTVPNLWDLKQDILRLHELLRVAGEEELLHEILASFPEVFTTITLGVYLSMAPLKSPFRSPGWNTLARETIKSQGAFRKGILHALEQGGHKDVIAQGVGVRISQVVRTGTELVVKRSHITKMSQEVAPAMGKHMHAAFEAAAIQAGKTSGAKSVRIIIEVIKRETKWWDYLTQIGYKWEASVEGIGLTKVFPL